MEKGYRGTVRAMNEAERRLSALFDELPFDNLSENECQPMLEMLCSLEGMARMLLIAHDGDA